MEKSENSTDNKNSLLKSRNKREFLELKISNEILNKHRIVIEEVERFKELVKGHEKILEAIGNL